MYVFMYVCECVCVCMDVCMDVCVLRQPLCRLQLLPCGWVRQWMWAGAAEGVELSLVSGRCARVVLRQHIHMHIDMYTHGQHRPGKRGGLNARALRECSPAASPAGGRPLSEGVGEDAHDLVLSLRF